MDFIVVRLFFGLIFSFLFTYYLLPICITIAHKYCIIDKPDGCIKVHENPTPYLGGAAIYIGFLATLGLVFPFNNQFFLFLIGSTLLFYVGFIDDLIALKPYQKFTGQGIAVLCFLKAGFYLKSYFFYQVWTIPVSALWMLLVINAFNLIDIMDGLASLVALCASINFLYISLIMEQQIVSLFLCSFIGSLGAFFCFNKPRAKIYMGDAGSLFIGGLLSVIPFLFPWSSIGFYGYVVPIVVLAIPLLEVVSLICIRTIKRIPFYRPSKDHFALYLKRKGFNEYEILYFVAGASLVLMVTSILFVYQSITFAHLALLGALFLVGWAYFIF